MSLRIRDTGATRTAIEVRFRDGDGVTKPIERMYARTEAGLGEFYRRGIRVSVSPNYASGVAATSFRPAITNSVVASAEGGTPPYSHSWARTAGYPATATQPNSAMTSFSAPGEGESYSQRNTTFTDTITDANGLTNTVTVAADFTWGA